MLAASGQLQLEHPAESIVARIGEGEVGRGIKDELLDEPYPYRSVYLPIIRGIVPEFLKVFDFPEPSNSQGVRSVTNVPAQSLFLMNSPFVIEQSEVLAGLILEQTTADDERVDLAFTRCLSRKPTADERESAVQYIAGCRAGQGMSEEQMSDAERVAWETYCQALFASAEFRYVD